MNSRGSPGKQICQSQAQSKSTGKERGYYMNYACREWRRKMPHKTPVTPITEPATVRESWSSGKSIAAEVIELKSSSYLCYTL